MRGAVRPFEASFFSTVMCGLFGFSERVVFSVNLKSQRIHATPLGDHPHTRVTDTPCVVTAHSSHHTIYYPILSPHLRRLGRLLPEDFCGGDELYGVVISAGTDE